MNFAQFRTHAPLFLAGALVLAGCGSSASSAEPNQSPDAGGGVGPADDDGGGSGANDASKPASGSDGGSDEGAGTGKAITGLHVVMGSNGAPGHIVDGSGTVVQLHGADRSGTEFACLYGNFEDGPVDQPGIDAMLAWNINAVRVPMNEDCWLGINGVPSAYSGASYQSALASWVNLLTSNGLVVILDLHWTAPGTTLSNAQEPMPDADHAPTFWAQVAKTFAGNSAVIFDLFNEPFVTDWGCWLSGGACAQANGATYTVAGMASLLQAVRGAGAENVVILGGLAYSSDMSQWVTSVNSIPTLAAPLNGIAISNVAASWHAYDFSSEETGCPSQYNSYAASQTCNTGAVTAMNTSATTVLAAGFPVVIGELGISAFSATTAASFSAAQITDLEGWLDSMATWAESEGQSYLAWSWDTDTDPVLVTDYTGTATVDFGVTYQAHLKKF